MPPPVDLLGHVAAAAAEQPDAVTTLQNALSGLGHAYVAFGNAILAIDVKKATSSGTEGGGKKKRVSCTCRCLLASQHRAWHSLPFACSRQCSSFRARPDGAGSFSVP